MDELLPGIETSEGGPVLQWPNFLKCMKGQVYWDFAMESSFQEPPFAGSCTLLNFISPFQNESARYIKTSVGMIFCSPQHLWTLQWWPQNTSFKRHLSIVVIVAFITKRKILQFLSSNILFPQYLKSVWEWVLYWIIKQWHSKHSTDQTTETYLAWTVLL